MATNGAEWARLYPELAGTQGNIRKPPPQPKRAKGGASPGKPPELPLPSRNGDVITLWLPLPAEELHPNAAVHFQNKGRFARAARNASAAMATLARLPEPWDAACLDATFYLYRVRDEDGLWAWLKHYIDGLQKIIIKNDSCLKLGTLQQVSGKKHTGGNHRVEFVITKIE